MSSASGSEVPGSKLDKFIKFIELKGYHFLVFMAIDHSFQGKYVL